MTHEEIAAAVVDVMQEQMALALAPVLTRLAVAETQVAHVVSQTHAMGELRDRVVVVETKSAMPSVTLPTHTVHEFPDPVDLSPVLERLSALETNVAHQTAQTSTLSEIRDRLVVVETKAAIPVPIPAVFDPPSPVDLAPVVERLTILETQRAQHEAHAVVLGDLRDRVVAVEMKAAMPVVVPESIEPKPVDLSPVLERLSALETHLAHQTAQTQTLSELRDRVVVVETKAAMPVVVPEPVESEPVDLSPLIERLSVTDAKVAALEGLRDQVKAFEIKAAQPTPPVPVVDLSEIHTKLATVDVELKFKAAEVAALGTTITDHSKDLSALRERVAVVESKPPVPGPKGDPGEPGHNGKDGDPGKAGLDYVGVYQEGKAYDVGQMVTWGGSTWHCNQATTTKPGDDSKSWTLMVKRGRDGKDFRDGIDKKELPVVSVGARPSPEDKERREIEGIRRSDLVKRAAPWEGQGRRE